MSTYPTAAGINPLEEGQTCRNLRSAFLRESQSRRLYIACARRMEEASLHVIAHAFRFTAAQEKEHADICRGLLSAYGGSCIPFSPDTAPSLPDDPPSLLDFAAQAERHEGERFYPRCARAALEEGYPRIAEAFRRIGETECLHAQRFEQYAAALREGRLFHDAAPISWVCMPCGEIFSGPEAPLHCAACGRDQGHFIRSSYYPFSV